MAYEPFVGFGTRKGVVYELNANHLPNATSTDPYVGLEIYGIRGLTITQTNVRRIAHYDGDRVALTQILPTLDVPSGTITVDGADLSLSSILGNVLPSTVGDFELAPEMTDQQGSEPEIGLLVYQAAKKNTGTIGWHVTFIPSTQAIPAPGSFGDNNYETTYQLAPSASPNHLFGPVFTTDDDGTLTAGVVRGFGLYKPRITAWLADGSEDEFLFDTSLQAVNTSYPVFIATPQTGGGVEVTEVTGDITKATDGVTFTGTGGIGADVLIIALHGVA